LKTILTLIRKEYRLFFSDILAVSLTFFVPVALILLWGSIFGNVSSGPEHIRMAFLNLSNAPVAGRIERGHLPSSKRTRTRTAGKFRSIRPLSRTMSEMEAFRRHLSFRRMPTPTRPSGSG
jgi:hypothetical protein